VNYELRSVLYTTHKLCELTGVQTAEILYGSFSTSLWLRWRNLSVNVYRMKRALEKKLKKDI